MSSSTQSASIKAYASVQHLDDATTAQLIGSQKLASRKSAGNRQLATVEVVANPANKLRHFLHPLRYSNS